MTLGSRWTESANKMKHCMTKKIDILSRWSPILYKILFEVLSLISQEMFYLWTDIDSGSSMDWVKGILKLPITFTYELRDDGQYGSLLPAKYIIPNAEEVLDSFLTLFQESSKLGYPRKIRS